MHIAFRADSSTVIGSGHIYRCLSLAQLILQKNHRVLFICKDDPGNFTRVINQQQLGLKLLAPDLNVVDDAFETLNVLKANNCRILVIDHYQLDSSYETFLRKNGIEIVVIDDLMSRKHDCKILIDQNFKVDYQNSYNGLVPDDCLKFLGPGYALLREEFYHHSNETKKNCKIKNVLVFFGGSDQEGETLRFIDEIEATTSQFHFKILISKGNKYLSEIKSRKLFQCELIIDPGNVAMLMRNCDFYFGSGGSITWERMAIGLNGAIVIVADNQRLSAEELAKADLQFYYGWARDFKYIQLIQEIEKINLHLISTFSDRSKRCKNLINKDLVYEMIDKLISL